MKKIVIITALSLITLQTYAISLADIKDVCTEMVAQEAKQDKEMDLRAQKMAEDVCICVGLEMSNSISKKKFIELLKSNDESMNSIMQNCLMQEMFSTPEMQLLMLSDF